MSKKTPTVPVDELLLQYPPATTDLAETLRSLVLEVEPSLSESAYPGVKSINFGGYNGHCYLILVKGGVNLGFGDGASLPNPEALLAGTGKANRHVKECR